MSWLQFKSFMLDVIVICTLIEWSAVVILPFCRGWVKGYDKHKS